jgi:hypothetical protein
VNQACEQMGLGTTQLLATLVDGTARHTPDGFAFKARAEQAGWKQAVTGRDSGEPIAGATDDPGTRTAASPGAAARGRPGHGSPGSGRP